MPTIIGMQLRREAPAPSTATHAPAQCEWEQRLLERITRRDAVALSELYDRHASQVYALALAGTGEPALAEAVTEEVFMEVWSAPERFRASTIPLSKWLLAIALRCARKARRV